MSYFAILKSVDLSRIEVDGCHINLWLIREKESARTYLDVGITIPGDIRRGKFRVAIPVTTRTAAQSQGAGCRSLHAETRNLENATRIWGEHVAASKSFHQTLEIGRVDPKVLYVAEATATKDPKLATETGEVWEIAFIRPDPDASHADDSIPTYVRLRFDANSTETLIQEIDGGVIVDLRMADIRNVRSGHAWSDLAAYLVKFDRAQIFVIAPSAQQLVAYDPPFEYIRVLESEVWTDYLSPQPENKMTVFYWKKSGKVIAEDSPFRGFISLEQPHDARPSNAHADVTSALQSHVAIGLGISVGVLSYLAVTVFVACMAPLWNWLLTDPPVLKALGGFQILLAFILPSLVFLGLIRIEAVREWMIQRLRK